MEEQSPFDQLGGHDGVRQLVTRFYDLMDSLPETQEVRAMHPANLTGSREKLILFLTGWLGGPQLYVERYGHPRLRARHLPFEIATPQAVQWMICMDQALEETVADENFRVSLAHRFAHVAAHMRNRPDPETPS